MKKQIILLIVEEPTNQRHMAIHWGACTTSLSNIKKTKFHAFSWINAFDRQCHRVTSVKFYHNKPPPVIWVISPIKAWFPSVFTPELSAWAHPHVWRHRPPTPHPTPPSCLYGFANWRTFVIFVFGLSESFAATLYFTRTKKIEKLRWGDVTTQQEVWGDRLAPMTIYGGWKWARWHNFKRQSLAVSVNLL